jgi:hypothetical protein
MYTHVHMHACHKCAQPVDGGAPQAAVGTGVRTAHWALAGACGPTISHNTAHPSLVYPLG